MGRVNLPTNMTSEESAHYLGLFDPYFSDEEEEFVSELFEPYLFYETWGRKDVRECVCTHCRCGRFEVSKTDKPRFFKYSHGECIECPNCGEPVQLVALGRMRTFSSLEETRRVTICRAGKNGELLLTSGWAKKEYSWNDLKPIVWFNEKVRTCLLPGKRMQWKKQRDWYGYRHENAGWVECPTVGEPFAPFMWSSDGSYYFMFPERIQDTSLRYCQLGIWYHEVTSVDIDDMRDPVRQVVRYLSAYTQYPAIEMAVKLGLSDAVQELVCDGLKNSVYINWKATTPAEFLRMQKTDAKAFIRSEGQLAQLRIFRELNSTNSVENMQQYLSLVMTCGGSKPLARLNGIARSVGISLKQACNYVRKVAGSADTTRTMQLWNDYIDMGHQLGYDFSRPDVLMPKDLGDRHDTAVKTIKVQLEEEQNQRYRQRYKQLRKLYEFELDDLCIVVPKSAQEIVNEGKTLQHCVGGYADRHITGKVDILFLRHRKTPDRPYITIEMRPRVNAMSGINMVQIHGFRNERYKDARRPEEKHRCFLDTWSEWMLHGSKRDKKGRPILLEEKEKSA